MMTGFMWVAVFLLEAVIVIGTIFADGLAVEIVTSADVPGAFSSISKFSSAGCDLDLVTLDFLTFFLSFLDVS